MCSSMGRRGLRVGGSLSKALDEGVLKALSGGVHDAPKGWLGGSVPGVGICGPAEEDWEATAPMDPSGPPMGAEEGCD